MASSTSYGMGQYRYNLNYNYILKQDIKADAIGYYKSNYQDIQVKLPVVSSGNNINTPYIQYGNTYYMRLTIPQHPQYDTTLILKLCPGDSNQADSIDVSRFQEIKRLIVPKTLEDDDVFSDVILFEVPKLENGTWVYDNTNVFNAHLWDEKHDYSQNDGVDKVFPTHKIGEIYYEQNNGQDEYRYYYDSNEYCLMKNNFYIGQLPQTWKMRDTVAPTVTFDFVFSPKYNLTGGYPYLLIETDRTDNYHQSIQYIDTDGETYYGTRIDREDIQIELYGVSNLLESSATGGSQIQSGSSSLSHVAVWGHPGQLLAINGEEIRIGQSGFYELNNFTINQLGVVVYDRENDRFTIDYEYKIIS